MCVNKRYCATEKYGMAKQVDCYKKVTGNAGRFSNFLANVAL